jgi:glycosyltransferase involved in cell wall biosynthesis
MEVLVRILWFSNSPHVGSGYGTQTKLFLPRITSLGHEVAAVAFYGNEGGIIDWCDIRIYPKGQAAGPFGIDTQALANHARHFKADLAISLMDVWCLPPGVAGEIPFAPWFPIDSEPLPPPVKTSLQGVLMPLVFSHFGERMMREAGLDYRYVPHGVDTEVYSPQPKRETREKLGLPTDAFIVGIVAANKGVPCRKAIKQQIEAFSRLHRKHPDTVLYLHTMAQPGDGENLPELCAQLGLTDGSVMFSDQYLLTLGFGEDQVRDLYSSFDVLTNVSLGEGFGLTILEAQACGTPVIVGDWTSMSELCFSGWLVDKEAGAEPWHTPLASYQFQPRMAAIFEQMEAAYLATDREERGVQARQHALVYDADRVTDEYWKPVLDELAQMIAERRPKAFGEYLRAV